MDSRRKSLLFVHFGDLRKNGRSLHLYGLFTHIFLVKEVNNSEREKLNSRALFFLKLIRGISKSDFIYVDNRISCLFILPLIPFISRKRLIVDMRELYVLNESKSIVNFLGTIIEHIVLKKAGLILFANRRRLEYVRSKRRYGAKFLVFENRRRLIKNNCKCSPQTERNIDLILRRSGFKCISTSGFSNERGNLEILELASLYKDIQVFFIGNSTSADSKFLDNYIRRFNLRNVTNLETVPFDELHNIIRLMDIGIVQYSMKNINNALCASGKIYEFLDLKIPVITSDNLSLIDIIELTKSGVSRPTIRMAYENYMEIKEQVGSNLESLDVNDLIDNYSSRFVKKLKHLVYSCVL